MRLISHKRFPLIASLLIIAAFSTVALVLNHGLSFVAFHDPTQITNTTSAPHSQTLPVKITTPEGSHWKYVDFSQGTSLASFLNGMGEDLFGKAAYAQSAPPLRGLDENFTPKVPNMVHLIARHHSTPPPTGLSYAGKTYKTAEEASAAWDKDGPIFYDKTVHNLRTNAGINWQYNQMAGTTAAVCTYIGLSNSGATPAATDTTLASEITTNGLQRVVATPTHSSNATSYVLAYTFTATGTQSAQNAGMFNANFAGGGTMCFENTFAQVNLLSLDTLSVSWTIQF